MKSNWFLIVVLTLTLMSCEEEVYDQEDLVGTWQLDWKRCENFHVSAPGSLTFSITDSTENEGVLEEYIQDSLYIRKFHFTFETNESLVIDSIYDTDDTISWLGSHTILDFSSGRFQLERENMQCEGEQFQFVK